MQPEINLNDFWETAKRNKSIEYSQEKVIFNFTKEEFSKCRFKLIDQNTRMAECTVHLNKFSHGYRLHPPHLFDLKNGVLYKKFKGKWVKFIPNLKVNIDRLEESKKEIN